MGGQVSQENRSVSRGQGERQAESQTSTATLKSARKPAEGAFTLYLNLRLWSREGQRRPLQEHWLLEKLRNH